MRKQLSRILIQLILIIFLIMGCKSENTKNDDIKLESTWDTFINAMKDELLGEPSDKALAKTKHFSQAGIAFDYPAPLRLRRDDSDTSWNMTYGDFELELYATVSDLSASEYLGFFANILGSGEKFETKGPGNSRKVNWCGHEIQGSVIQLTLLGDLHIMEAFDLPAPDGESRILIFEDVSKKEVSKVAEATFSTVDSSIRCEYLEKK